MTDEEELAIRIRALLGIVGKELDYLQQTDARLFVEAFTIERAELLEYDPVFSERVEAFVSRFGRLQDTLGDKLIPLYMQLIGEKPKAFVDNLDRMEKLEVVDDAHEWPRIRRLRNLMVHEHINDMNVFVKAINDAHDFIPSMVETVRCLSSDILRRIGA